MLGEDYIKINNIEYTPSTFKYKSDPVENVLRSEAGTDLVNVVRLRKYAFELTWEGITYELMSELEAYCYSRLVTLKWKGTEYSCRAREGNSTMIDHSWRYRGSDGLWNFSMSLIEV